MGFAEITSPAPVQKMAAPKTSKETEEIPLAKVSLSEAIKKAKSVINIPGDYDQFQSSLNSYRDRIEWNLHWNRSKEPHDSISVRINAVSGEITGMHCWKQHNPGEKYSRLPEYSYHEAAELAKKWAQKLSPKYYPQTKMEIVKYNQSITPGRPAEYYYKFIRVVNGISYPENSIHIGINAYTGELISFNLKWNETEQFPSPVNKIPKGQAEKIFSSQVELVYFSPHTYNRKDIPVILTYQVNKGRSLYINALTGEVIESPRYHILQDGKGEEMGADVKEDKALTPAEIKEVEKYNNIISAEKAVQSAEKIINIAKEQKLAESRLTRNYRYPQQLLWKFYWKDENSGCHASIDAVTGELVSFNKWNSLHEFQIKNGVVTGEKVKYTQEQAEKAASDFIKKMQPEHYKKIRLESALANNIYLKEGKVMPRDYHFSFTRLVNGIPYPGNGFEITVNAWTGEITYYRMEWWNIDFPPASGVINKERAVNKFLSQGQLDLSYVRLQEKEEKLKTYLVYHCKDMPSHLLNAHTGSFIDWRGEPLPPQPTREFSDISGHPAEENINLLTSLNIIKSSEDKFYPDKKITKLEVLAWLVGARGWQVNIPYEKNAEKIIDAALHLGILEKREIVDLNKELTRLEWAQLMINALDYDGAAELEEIYLLNTEDAASVPSEMKGYASLSLGLKLLSPIDNKFYPGKKITKAEAAVSLVNLLKVKK